MPRAIGAKVVAEKHGCKIRASLGLMIEGREPNSPPSFHYL
jgi:hypothetical protein